MKIRYNMEQDILLIEVSDESIEYAEEVGPIIVHFTKGRKPVLLEIIDASEFLTDIAPNQLIDLERARLLLVAKPELSTITV